MLTRKRLRVTYSQAACLYFGVENTLENKRRCIEKLSPYHDSTLVYTDDPDDPLVMSNVKINCRAITYKKYLPDDPDAVEQLRKQMQTRIPSMRAKRRRSGTRRSPAIGQAMPKYWNLWIPFSFPWIPTSMRSIPRTVSLQRRSWTSSARTSPTR